MGNRRAPEFKSRSWSSLNNTILSWPVAIEPPWGEDVPPVLPAQGAAAPDLLLPAIHLQGPLPGGLLLPGQLPAGVQGLEPAGLLHLSLEEGQGRPQHTGAGRRQSG